jgi:signal transduction histidine kinase
MSNGNNGGQLRKELGDAYRRIAQRNVAAMRREDDGGLRESPRMLGDLRKMEMVGQLTTGLTQYFNNILTLIIGYGGYLQGGLDEKDPLRPYVHQILASSERAALLTRSLLAFCRKQVADPKPVGINEIVRRAGRLLGRIMGEGVEFRTSLCRAELTVMADAVQIEQVMMNLATNARDAMPHGGTLTVETRAVGVCHPLAEDGKNAGGCAMISFSDTGAGIDEHVRDRIFVPFYTTKEPGKAAGLGLSIVYGIIKQHNGSINVTSQPGRGTTLSIYLPLLGGMAAGERAREETAASMVGGARCP